MNIKNDCPIRKNCGACQLQNMEYEEQLSYKMSRAIAKLGKFCKVSEIIEMEEPFHYRNKAQVMFGSRSGRVVTGIYKSSTGGMAVMNSCLLDDIKADKIIASTKKLVSDMRITAYNPKTDRGILRHMMVRVAHGTGEIMVVIVTSGPDLPKRRDFVTELCKKHPEITTIVQCVNDTETPLWLGTREFVLHGTGYIEDVLQGCKFRLSAKSFYQINTVQTERLYNKIRDFAKPQKTDVILDAYCGIGTIGLSMAKDVELVVGVESNESSIEDANVNAKINGIKNAKFIKSDAGRYMQMAANEGAKINTMIIDPPRAGCDRKVIASIIKLKPEKLIYVSCNIETQARDLAALTKNGYKVFRIQPIDMFPHTRHVETVVLLTYCGETVKNR